ncbi:GIY-YIG nuclease family protein [Methyloglobulus sp.]|uniref:GIY-YIG nuclease family protein n=1 Tax=Methyloglobulus sp. TaxID=2518622 RepID=UPI0032B852F2
MDKQQILDEIKRTAIRNGGVPLGQERFAREVGVKIAEWHGRYWLRWSEALTEAGFQPNKYNMAYSDDFVLEKLAVLTLELGHYPIKAEIKMKAREDENFPSHTVFERLGNKSELNLKLQKFCFQHNEYSDVVPLLPILKSISDNENLFMVSKGYVYLMKHGSRNEYKIGRTNNVIRREGELSIELPEKLSPIHTIETDDPAGIEKYWHSRFSQKRKNGEWFSLSAEDVKAFKRWKRIC